MACFLVPMGEAIATSIVQKVIEKKEEKVSEEKSEKRKLSWSGHHHWSQRLSWLNKLLWGGVILLAIEHIWHGEVSPLPPFLTAMKTPEEIPVMLHEMGTVGVTMAIVVTATWAAIVMIAERTRKAKPIPEERKVEVESLPMS